MAPETRHVRLLSSLPPDQLMLQRVRGREELGRPFVFELELLSPDPSLALDDLLGDSMTIALELTKGTRYFNGICTRIEQGGRAGRFTRYRCELRPFSWLLTRTSDSRIFKRMTIPEIVQEVVAHLGVGDVEMKLHGTYLSREYTVMYRETYFDFLSRLLEEEGIAYHFRHEEKKHVLVLADDRGSYAPAPDYAEIPFIDPEQSATAREEHFSGWTLTHEVASGAFAVNDFDFEVPRANLLARSARALPHKHADLEQYDPLAGYVEALDAGNNGDVNRDERGELFARVRLEELQAEHDRAVGRGGVRGPGVGSTFKLTRHPRGDQNRELLVVRAEYEMFQPGYDAGSAAGEAAQDPAAKPEPLFDVRLTVQPAKTPFRPRRATARPDITGPHAATVVGDGEIWTDKYGRVKVHFPWDREDTEGCWVRVAQAWAGAGWGGLQVPRVGHEVIVEFLEGDPDRPIITGRVYNGSNAAPFGLPGGATVSGFLTRSTPGGSADNANELRFEDKKGSEQVLIHAERNMDTEVENDQTTWVGHDRKKTVDNDQSEEIKGNKTIKVHKDHTEDVVQNVSLRVGKNQDDRIGGNRTIQVTGDHTETVDGKQGVTVGKDAAWSVGGNGAITFGGTGALSVSGNHTEEVGGKLEISVAEAARASIGKNLDLSVTGDRSDSVGKALTMSVTKDATLTVGGTHKVTVTKDVGIEGKKITIEGHDQLILKSGDATITLKSNGDITIKGNKISIKGDGDVTLKGSKVATN
jgi:type VI secretion system secreted protein VgrG